MIEILTSGLVNSVQDLGRTGYLDQGIGQGGAMDAAALRLANIALGNPEGAAGLEIAVFPFRMKVLRACRFIVTGALCPTTLNGAELPPWWVAAAHAGDEVRIEPPAKGARAMVGLSGGIDVPEVLGSRSTDLKSGFGGHMGRALKRGDRLGLQHVAQAAASDFGIDPMEFRDFGTEANVLRFMRGAEFPDFTARARHDLADGAFRVSQENNRQGMRLEGITLPLARKLELFSHGIMPGTIQVPPSGQPVIQLAEANTCGGYAKIGHVIPTDFWKLAQAATGSEVRFEEVSREQAIAEIRREELRIRKLKNLLPIARKHGHTSG